MRKLFLSFICLLNLSTGYATAQSRADVEAQYQTWLAQVIWPEAKARGVSRTTFEQAFNGVRLNWDLPDLVVPGQTAKTPKQQRQAEFGSPGRYFNRGSVDGATSVGRQMARTHADMLDWVERETGVPGRIILGIWGRESGYGRVDIPHNAFEVLGTKGFMSRRAEYFRGELLAALQIAEAGHAGGVRLKKTSA